MSNERTLKMERSLPLPTGDELSFPEIEFKPEDYADLVGELNLSDTEANEFLLTLWNIMRIFAQMGLQPKDVPIDVFTTQEKSGADSDSRVEIFNTASTVNVKG